jgi:hypothetical protein
VTEGRDWPRSIWLMRLGETPMRRARSEIFRLRCDLRYASRSPIRCVASTA